jgi:hypothetical protein
MIKFSLSWPLTQRTGPSPVTADGSTLRQALEHLDQAYPGLLSDVVNSRGEIRPSLAVFVDGWQSRGLDEAIKDGSLVDIQMSKAGG